jgi:hypothetical protein
MMRLLPISVALVALAAAGCNRKSQSSCIANLRMIDGAKVALATDQKLTNGTVVTKDQLLRYLREWPACPEGGQYSIGNIAESPKCSYPAHSHYEEPRD